MNGNTFWAENSPSMVFNPTICFDPFSGVIQMFVFGISRTAFLYVKDGCSRWQKSLPQWGIIHSQTLNS